MAEIRILPTNFFSWPAVNILVPDMRLVAVYVWTCGHTTSCGCYLLPLAPAAVELGLSVDALLHSLSTLQQVHLGEFDRQTSEVLVLRWQAFHRFRSSAQQALFWRDVEKIQSQRLRDLVLENCEVPRPATKNQKSGTYPLTNKTELNVTNSRARAREPHQVDPRAGHFQRVGAALLGAGGANE